jgi:hypothetical protein
MSATADSSCGEFVRFKCANGRTRCGELGAHFLETRGKRINLLLLRVNLAACFEKLIEQHRVDLVVTYTVRLSFFVPHH